VFIDIFIAMRERELKRESNGWFLHSWLSLFLAFEFGYCLIYSWLLGEATTLHALL